MKNLMNTLFAVLILSGTVPEKPKKFKLKICPPNQQCKVLTKVVAL